MMTRFRSRFVFLLSVLMLIILSSGVMLAQDDAQSEVPIIALSENKIYAVSPSDGSSRLLVEWNPDKNEPFDYWTTPQLVLGPISPDQTHFAYMVPLYETVAPAFATTSLDYIPEGPNEVMVMDIATGTPINITQQGDHLAEQAASYTVNAYLNPVWSRDGTRLYFQKLIVSQRNRATQTIIEYYDLASGERHEFVNLHTQTGVTGFYAFDDNLAVLRRTNSDIAFELLLYDAQGNLNFRNNLTLENWWGIINGTMITVNPVLKDGVPYFSFYTEDNRLALFDVASGETSVVTDDLLYLSMISRANPDTSLRIVLTDLYGYDNTSWTVMDLEGNPNPAFSLRDALFQAYFALSPDGQSVAHLSLTMDLEAVPVPITVTDETGTRELDFKASEIKWGVVDYTFVRIQAQG